MSLEIAMSIKLGVLLKLLVNAFVIENDLEEGLTRVHLSLTDGMGDYKNENISYSEIEANWSVAYYFVLKGT